MNRDDDNAQVAVSSRSHEHGELFGPSTAAIDALAASSPARERAAGLALFGQLVGSWEVDVTYFAEDGSTSRQRSAEWHFGWVLEGRAVQDVLFGPPTAERRRTGAPAREYGTSIRMYDPESGIWQVSWFAPVHGVVVHLAGGREGDSIVLEGTELDGTRCRWVFSEITPDAFLWRGYEAIDPGVQRPLVQQMQARRLR